MRFASRQAEGAFRSHKMRLYIHVEKELSCTGYENAYYLHFAPTLATPKPNTACIAQGSKLAYLAFRKED